MIKDLPKRITTAIIFIIGEVDTLKKIAKPIAKSLIYASFIALFVAPSINPSWADTSSSVTPLTNKSSANSQDIKVAPLKSFFARFVKPKKEKKPTATAPAESSITTIKGGITLSIDDCVNFALKNDPNIKNYADTQKAQKSAVGVAKSNYFPRLMGGTGYNFSNVRYSGSGAPSRNDSGNNNYYGLNLSVNQLIWDFGSTTAQINMNKYNYEAAGYDLTYQILNSTYNVRIAYTAVLAARANEDIYSRSVRINELNVQRTKAMYEVGLKSKIDVVNAQVNLTNAQISLLQAQNTYQTSLITLNNAMYYVNAPDYAIKDTETFNFQKNYSVKNEIDVAYNRKNYDPNGVDAELKDGAILASGIEKQDILRTYKFKPFNLSMQEAIDAAYANRPDLKSMELVEKASQESLKAIKRSAMPVINGSAGYNTANYSDYNSSTLGAYVGVNLPTINGMSIKYQIEQGKAYLDIAKNNVDLLKSNIYFNVQGYYINMKQLEKTIPLMSQKVAQTLENFELADGRYAVGVGNYLELQQAQTDYNNAQLAFVQSVFDYNQALFYLKKAMGTL